MKLGLFATALTTFAVAGFAPLQTDAAGLQGGYTTSPQEDLRACAAACESDGLCMSWAFSDDGQCALSAVAPAAAPEGAWGLASRAPRYAWSPVPASSAAATASTSRRAEPAFRSPFERAPAQASASDALLGGPEGPDGLRLRFASDRP